MPLIYKRLDQTIQLVQKSLNRPGARSVYCTLLLRSFAATTRSTSIAAKNNSIAAKRKFACCQTALAFFDPEKLEQLDILEVLQQGKLEYTKARAIAKLKDDQARRSMLEEAIEKNLSLAQIKQRLKDLTSTVTNEPTASDRLVSVSRKLKEKKGLNDPKKKKRLEKLLQELESLIED